MNVKYKIKNFRIFSEEGVDVSLKPITLLTGCNSSGKSSLVKSLLLLSDYLGALKSDNDNGKRIDLTAHKLDFTKSPHCSLGKFSKVVNNKSEVNTVSFGIQTHSEMLGQEVYLELVFAAGESDSTNGYIKSITISKVDGTMIYHSDVENKSIGNLYGIMDEFVRFSYTQHLLSAFESACFANEVGIGETMSDDELKEFEQKLKEHLNYVETKYGRKVLLDINKWNNSHNQQSFISKIGINPIVIEKVKDYGILYYIPFIGEKLNGRKDDVCAVLEECKIRETDKATVSIMDKIISDFKASPYDSFVEYYKGWEQKYLTGFKFKKRDNSDIKYPNVPNSHGVGLDAHAIAMSPYHIIFQFDPDRNELELAKKKEEQIAQWEAKTLSFEAVFEALCILSEKYCPKDYTFFNEPNEPISIYGGCIGYIIKSERLFLSFVEESINEIIVGAMAEAMSYVSSSVVNVKRLYPLESTDEFTGVLKRFIEARRNLDKKSDYVPNTFVNKWVKAFGLGEKVTLNVDPEGLGVTLRLHKDDADLDGSLLADNGYGITQLFALLLNVEVSIMERSVYEKQADDSIGGCYTDELIKVFSSPTIAVEEPEIHLHPSYQSMLADMFYDAYKNYGIHFIVETHSEYLIRKSQLIVSKLGYKTNDETEEKCPFVTYYVPNSGIPYSLGYRKDGKFAESFGSGFYDEASNLAFEIL